MLKIVDIFTRAILIPGIWIFICMNIPGIREDCLDLFRKIGLRNKMRVANAKQNCCYKYKKVA